MQPTTLRYRRPLEANTTASASTPEPDSDGGEKRFLESRKKERNSMSIRVTIQEERDVSIVHISGKLTFGEGTSALPKEMRGLAEGARKRILVNMADVTCIDSSGIGELLASRTAITKAGGEIKLLNVARRMRDDLNITRLYTFFEVFEDKGAAIASFGPRTDLELRWARFMDRIIDQSIHDELVDSRDAELQFWDR
jgi:anti-sigma B factor antagonist